MSNSTSFESSHKSFIDGQLVAEVSNTFSEAEGLSPFDVRIIGLPPLQANSIEDALQWLNAITRVTEKALAYEYIVSDIEDDNTIIDLDVVDALTDDETDSEWSDIDDDHYKHIDGEWHISFRNGRRPWRPVEDDDLEFLTECGPYRKVQ